MELPAKILIIIDPHEINLSHKAGDMLSVLWDFDQWLRAEYKYNNNEAAYNIRLKLFDVMNEHDITLDNLME